ncbi:MAG: hypothetical protein OEZ03_01365 [Alphaproteobacteria bacterium]|nr:hypothetical protein [Alphaproteobacteria bacterium]
MAFRAITSSRAKDTASMSSTDRQNQHANRIQAGSIGSLQRWAPVILYALLALIAVYPVFIVDIPPLTDYSPHLAEIHIQTTIANNPDLQAHYAFNWKPLPNLAMQLIIPPLTAIFSLFDAGKIFVAAAILLPVAGTAILRKTIHGYVGYAPAFAFLPAYNMALMWGFLNFLFTSGLCLMAFAGWVASSHWRPQTRIALFSVVAIILYFFHLFAFAIYAVLIAVYTIRPALEPGSWPVRKCLGDLAGAGAQFIGPALLLLPTLFSGEASYTDFNGWPSRFRAILSPVYSVGTPADILLITLASLVLYWALRNRRITLAPEIRLPLIVITGLAIIIPEWLMQTWGANIRLPAIAVFILLAGATLRLPPVRWQITLAAIFLTLFVVRVWTVAEVWRDDAQKFAEFRTAALSIPIGARVVPMQPIPDETPDVHNGFAQAYWGMTALLVIDRSAFVPSLFTDATKQLVSATDANSLIDSPFGTPATLKEIEEGAEIEQRGLPPVTSAKGKRTYWTDWPHRFDYMVAVHVKRPLASLEPLLEPVHTGSFFTIYRIIPGSCWLTGAAPSDPAQRFCRPDSDSETNSQ